MEVSISDIMRVLKRNLLFIIITALLAAACSFSVTVIFIPKTYTAAVKFYVEASSAQIDAGGSDNLASFNYAQKLVATYIELLDTDSYYSELSLELNGEYTAAELGKMISFKDVSDTEVFIAEVSSESPEAVKAVADAIAATAPFRISVSANDSAELKVVDYATVPAEPASPNIVVNTVAALAAGLVLAVALVFLINYGDSKVKYKEGVTEVINSPLYAAVPNFDFTEKLSDKKIELLRAKVFKAYVTAAKNIMYASVSGDCRLAVFTSAQKGEGKTSCVVNIASTLAKKYDKKVLIVDCNLSSPTIHSVIRMSPRPGLTNYLCGECGCDEIIKDTAIDNLSAIFYGEASPEPSALLASSKMSELTEKIRKDFDYIFFDTRHIDDKYDARSVLKAADTAIVVIKDRGTKRSQAAETVARIESLGVKTIGTIISGVKVKIRDDG